MRAQRIIVHGDAKSVRATVAARKILFLMAEAARKDFGSVAEQRVAVTAAFCALAGVTQPSPADRKLIERELAR